MKVIFYAMMAAVSMLMMSHDVFAQGETAVPFLLIAPDAQAGGMGQAGTGLADNGSAVFWNPGGLAFLKGTYLNLSHTPWLPEFGSDMTYDFLSATHYLPGWDGSVGASITYFNLGTFTETGPGGPTPLGTWHAFEYAVTLGYGAQVADGLGIGANFRYIHSALAPFGTPGTGEQGSGIASDVSFDLGVLYRPQTLQLPLFGDMGNRIGLGLDLSNMGPNLYYIDQAQADPLPTNLRVGIAVHALKSEYNNIYLVVDLSRTMVRVRTDSTYAGLGSDGQAQYTYYNVVDPLPQSLITTWSDGSGLKRIIFSGGAEYWYGHPRLIALRWGIYKESPSYGGRNFMTFGAGIRYSIYAFDFSYISTFSANNPLSNQLSFSLGLNFGGPSEF